ncbi:MAG: hypothetical protein JW712_06370 [Dehalococcoidales bacterium]|nr:hypothetical protein [Dehalococcoidales bacterium]
MIDFQAAYRAGLKAADDAELAREEIDQVFQDLNEQISVASEGKLQIIRHKFEAFESFSFSPPEKYTAIAAVNPMNKHRSPEELAKWSMDRTGYPCKINWGEKEELCQDKEALARSLADLISDPVVGEQLRNVALSSEKEKKTPQEIH